MVTASLFTFVLVFALRAAFAGSNLTGEFSGDIFLFLTSVFTFRHDKTSLHCVLSLDVPGCDGLGFIADFIVALCTVLHSFREQSAGNGSRLVLLAAALI